MSFAKDDSPTFDRFSPTTERKCNWWKLLDWPQLFLVNYQIYIFREANASYPINVSGSFQSYITSPLGMF